MASRRFGLLLFFILAHTIAPAAPWRWESRVVDGSKLNGVRALDGVRIYPDRAPKIEPGALIPVAISRPDGTFSIDLDGRDEVLVFEKSGYGRLFIPLCELKETVQMQKLASHRVERAMVVRVSFSDQSVGMTDDAFRRLLFSRSPGQASAANYLYEISKGALELEEGAILHLMDPIHVSPRRDKDCQSISEWVLSQLKDQDLKDFDAVDNRTGNLWPDGKPDHLWIIPPGPARCVTLDEAHLSPVSYLIRLPWQKSQRWGVVFFPEQTPLGNMVHELLHAMGEHRVDDLYMDADHPLTAGIWDLMDAGQYRGWDALVSKEGPWQSVLGYSPSHPIGWIRSELWYRGAFAETLAVHTLNGVSWEGWLDPAPSFPGALPQRLIIPYPRPAPLRGRTEREKARKRAAGPQKPLKKKGKTAVRRRGTNVQPEQQQSRWELEVRRPWGFERGRVGGRFGPGHQGLIVMRVNPTLLSEDGGSLGPVKVIDAHPGTPEPPQPRFPAGRWQLDDAAFNMGPGEISKGADGSLHWEVLAVDPGGRMKVRVWLQGC